MGLVGEVKDVKVKHSCMHKIKSNQSKLINVNTLT
jgi:hypothetical protein